MKKACAILLAISVLGVVISGCSGGDNANNGGTTTGTPPATTGGATTGTPPATTATTGG